MWINITGGRNSKRNIKELNLDDINKNEYKIIDVRSRREFSEKHIDGAINIPLPDIKKNIERYVKNKETKIVVCCEYGVRSKKAAEIIGELGYTQVFNLKGGLENI